MWEGGTIIIRPDRCTVDQYIEYTETNRLDNRKKIKDNRWKAMGKWYERRVGEGLTNEEISLYHG